MALVGRVWVGYGEGQAAREYTPRAFLPFEKARELVRKLGLTSEMQWEGVQQRPPPRRHILRSIQNVQGVVSRLDGLRQRDVRRKTHQGLAGRTLTKISILLYIHVYTRVAPTLVCL